VVGPARLALQRLSQLPDPPTSAVELTDLENPPGDATPEKSTVGFAVWMDDDGHLADPAALEVELHDVGSAGDCPDEWYDPRNLAARQAAAYLLIGRTPVPDGSKADPLIADAYRTVSALPEKVRLQRVSATRTAFQTCTGDPYAILTGDAR
jgi:hypothetical protein